MHPIGLSSRAIRNYQPLITLMIPAFTDSVPQHQPAYYANQAGLFSTVKGVKVSDKTIVGLQTYINQGRVIDFPDHYYPPAMAAGNQYESTLQGALSNKSSATSILTQLDALYKQSAAHQ